MGFVETEDGHVVFLGGGHKSKPLKHDSVKAFELASLTAKGLYAMNEKCTRLSAQLDESLASQRRLAGRVGMLENRIETLILRNTSSQTVVRSVPVFGRIAASFLLSAAVTTALLGVIFA